MLKVQALNVLQQKLRAISERCDESTSKARLRQTQPRQPSE